MYRGNLYVVGYLLAMEASIASAAVSLPIRGVKRKTLKSATLLGSNNTDHTIKSGIRNADVAVSAQLYIRHVITPTNRVLSRIST